MLYGSVLLLVVCAVITQVEGGCMFDDEYLCSLQEEHEQSLCPGHLWGNDNHDCVWRKCQCREGCAENTESEEMPCCDYCPGYDCECTKSCVGNENCCAMCHDGKVNATTGMVLEYFNLTDPEQVLLSPIGFQYQENAERFCQNQEMELVYAETRKAQAELELYMNKYIGYPERGKAWVDGTIPDAGRPFDSDWPIQRIGRENCLAVIDRGPNKWQLWGMNCEAMPDQEKQALCAKRTYKYKLQLTPQDEKIDHSTNGQLCFDQGLEMVFMKVLSKDRYAFYKELNRMGITDELVWLTGLVKDTEVDGKYRKKLYKGDSSELDYDELCTVSQVSTRNNKRILWYRGCSDRRSDYSLCYITPSQPPRYSIKSESYKTEWIYDDFYEDYVDDVK